ncbi:hypothetical protein [Sphingomonas hengshuiensis]|uniref:NlpC/P60 domain-containing protein n=1 Tax=Sphingomonas hengshuiensis TaxID=1609977 RepID=A0A7U4JA97_9SPHN|nr:hypothetical protein [Sphingomonas hengshuiensis]AJP73127.1 hypothetical protein TS85_16985 [Sphingomonas hengshuiensis]
MSAGARVVAAARGTVGARFRLHGRDVESGLDCVGLAALALGAGGAGGVVPQGYRLRSGDAARVAATIETWGLTGVVDAQPGDLLLLAAGPGQIHLAIDSGDGIVHADAMLRRVVERPGAPPWPVIGRWRINERRINQGE